MRRAVRPLRVACCCAVALDASAKKQKKIRGEEGMSTSRDVVGMSVLRRTGPAGRTVVGARAGSPRLRSWIARRALKMQAPTFADVLQAPRAPTND